MYQLTASVQEITDGYTVQYVVKIFKGLHLKCYRCYFYIQGVINKRPD